MRSYVLVIGLLCVLSAVLAQKFCSDSNGLKNVFFMGDYNYMKRESLYGDKQSYYRQVVNKTFKGVQTKGWDPYFRSNSMYFKYHHSILWQLSYHFKP